MMTSTGRHWLTHFLCLKAINLSLPLVLSETDFPHSPVLNILDGSNVKYASSKMIFKIEMHTEPKVELWNTPRLLHTLEEKHVTNKDGAQLRLPLFTNISMWSVRSCIKPAFNASKSMTEQLPLYLLCSSHDNAGQSSAIIYYVRNKMQTGLLSDV